MVALSFSLLFLLGSLGLAIDIGRMYIGKNEAQTFVDSATVSGYTYPAITPGLAGHGKPITASMPVEGN